MVEPQLPRLLAVVRSRSAATISAAADGDPDAAIINIFRQAGRRPAMVVDISVGLLCTEANLTIKTLGRLAEKWLVRRTIFLGTLFALVCLGSTRSHAGYSHSDPITARIFEVCLALESGLPFSG